VGERARWKGESKEEENSMEELKEEILRMKNSEERKRTYLQEC